MASWQRVRIDIPEDYKPSERIAIAEEVIDFIIERSKKGKDVENNSFPKYSKSYKNSKDFKIAGKSSNVDLTLSGDMLNSIQLISHKKGSVLIGFDRGDSTNNGKAEGNQIGSYGQKSGNPERARKFLGIQEKDLDKILKKYPKGTEEEKKKTRQRAIDIVRASSAITREVADE